MALTDTQQESDAINKGPLANTIRALPDPQTGDQDVRDFPSNGAIPDGVRNLIVPKTFHVP